MVGNEGDRAAASQSPVTAPRVLLVCVCLCGSPGACRRTCPEPLLLGLITGESGWNRCQGCWGEQAGALGLSRKLFSWNRVKQRGLSNSFEVLAVFLAVIAGFYLTLCVLRLKTQLREHPTPAASPLLAAPRAVALGAPWLGDTAEATAVPRAVPEPAGRRRRRRSGEGNERKECWEGQREPAQPSSSDKGL